MDEKNYFVKLFKTPSSYYIFDVNRNIILRTEKTVWESISNEDKWANKETIEKMINNGLLSPKRVSQLKHPLDEVIEDYLNNKLNLITLQITQQCNLRCNYCVYSGKYENREHSSQKMDFEIARKGIDFLVSHSKDSQIIGVGFYGGEPLLEFDLLTKIVEYAEKKAEGKEILFTLTTNSTLLNTKIVKYFVDHNISIVISLDGPKEIHDSNRKFASNSCGTFDKVIKNLENIRNNYKDYFDKKVLFNAVIDPENDFNCTSEFFLSYEALKDSAVNSTIIKDTYSKSQIILNEDFSIKISYEYFKVFLMMLKRIERKYVARLFDSYIFGFERLHRRLKPIPDLPEKGHHGGPCIPGVHRLLLNVKGDLYPCERVSETSEIMKIGNIDTGFDLEKVRRLLNIGQITEEECKKCWAFSHCYLCAAYADELTSISYKKKSSHCDRVRASVESNFKDYCTLREFGCNFDIETSLFNDCFNF